MGNATQYIGASLRELHLRIAQYSYDIVTRARPVGRDSALGARRECSDQLAVLKWSIQSRGATRRHDL